MGDAEKGANQRNAENLAERNCVNTADKNIFFFSKIFL